MFRSLPSFVRIVEVGARDGLQNEKALVALTTKVQLIERLVQAGIRKIEAASFVSKKWVPQMADSSDVMRTLTRQPGVTYCALTPNLQGFAAAVEGRADEIAIFGAVSEEFTRRNANCSIAESMQRFEPVVSAAEEHNIPVRGYISCVAGCPYEGHMDPTNVAGVARDLLDMGCFEVSLGVGTPESIRRMLEKVLERADASRLAVHFHDTYGQALANVLASLQMGVSVVDSSVAGLGGCPYAKGASGNLATEDLVYMLHGLGIETGIDLNAIAETGEWICNELKRPVDSKVGRALSAKRAASYS